MMELSLVFLSK